MHVQVFLVTRESHGTDFEGDTENLMILWHEKLYYQISSWIPWKRTEDVLYFESSLVHSAITKLRTMKEMVAWRVSICQIIMVSNICLIVLYMEFFVLINKFIQEINSC